MELRNPRLWILYLSILSLDLKNVVHSLGRMTVINIIRSNEFPKYFNLEWDGVFLMHKMSVTL